MTRNPDIPTLVSPAIGHGKARPASADSLAVGSVRSIRVKRSEMPKVLLASVRDEVSDALDSELSEVVSLLFRRLENEYHKHWQMGAKAN